MVRSAYRKGRRAFSTTKKGQKRFVEAARGAVKSTGIDDPLLGPLDYQIVSVGFTQNSDFRNDPVNPRQGFVINTSLDADHLGGNDKIVLSPFFHPMAAGDLIQSSTGSAGRARWSSTRPGDAPL
jgi:outer membrane protein assembly factor BamA